MYDSMIYAVEKLGLSMGLVGQQQCQIYNLLKSTNNPELTWTISGCGETGVTETYATADNPDGIDYSLNTIVYGIQALGRSVDKATQNIGDRLSAIEVDLADIERSSLTYYQEASSF